MTQVSLNYTQHRDAIVLSCSSHSVIQACMQQLLVVVTLCTLTQSCCVSHAATTNQSNTVWLDNTLNTHDLDDNGDGTMTKHYNSNNQYDAQNCIPGEAGGMSQLVAAAGPSDEAESWQA